MSIRLPDTFLHRYERLAYLLPALFLLVWLPSSWLGMLPVLLGPLLIVWTRPSWLPCWHILYLGTVLLIPPFFPSALGGTIPVHFCTIVLAFAAFLLLVQGHWVRGSWDSIERASARFLAVAALSLPFAFWVSGDAVGWGSLLRFLLLFQPFLVYTWLRRFQSHTSEESDLFLVRFLLVAGNLAVLYGIFDFYHPISVSHPFADQYIHLAGRSIRRAQGMLHDANSFGNLCAFLVVLATGLLFSPERRVSFSWAGTLLLLASISITGLLLSYSRGAWVNVLVALFVLVVLLGRSRFRLVLTLLFLAGGSTVLLYQFSPQIVSNILRWRIGALWQLGSDPNLVTSGRWETWSYLVTYFLDRPWYLVFGIGYKTIPLTNLFGETQIADNGFVSMFIETGVLGLSAFLALNTVILTALYQRTQEGASFQRVTATVLLGFWCGEMVQMLTADVFTYWRNLIVFFAVMGCAQAQKTSSGGPGQQQNLTGPVTSF